MAGEIHIEVRKPVLQENTATLRAEARGHPQPFQRRNGSILFEVPARAWDWLAVRGEADDCHDAFLRATLWPAMATGYDLTIHGRVSVSLLTNLERYQDIVCRWWPKYRPVRLQADEEIRDAVAVGSPASGAAHREAALLAFTGGLDSTESLAAHKSGWRGRNTQEIAACLFVHGFDIPPDDDAFQGAFTRARAITDAYATELVAVRSNLKGMLPLWTTTFPAGISAALSLFERRFGSGLMAASTAYENLHWVTSQDGSTALTNPLLSSATFPIVHDLAVTRVEKTARLARNRLVWKNLRVCWQGENLSTNCGRCEKCVRQMLCMLACGVEDFSAFQSPLTPTVILATELPLTVVVEEWQRCYAHAVQQGLGRHEAFVAMKQVLDNASAGHASKSGPAQAAGKRDRLRDKSHRLLRFLGAG